MIIDATQRWYQAGAEDQADGVLDNERIKNVEQHVAKNIKGQQFLLFYLRDGFWLHVVYAFAECFS